MPAERERFDFLEPPAGDATTVGTARADGTAGQELGRLGHYRVLDVLGRGGMGYVFRAEDTRLKRLVALKVMNRRFSTAPNSRKRFLEEARAMAAIDDDNVVTIYEVGESSGTPYMAMELLRGSTLERFTRGGQRLAVNEFVPLATQLIAGLSAAHRRGIVHRDVKPGNVWVEEPSSRVKVLDFGLALASTPVDALADDGSDLFSAGVVLYELACGQPPFSAQTIPEQLIKILAHQPLRPDAVNPGFPAQLADVIMRLLAKEPGDRYRSAQECVAALGVAAEAAAAADRAVAEIVVQPAAMAGKTVGKTVGKRAGNVSGEGAAKATGRGRHGRPNRRPTRVRWLRDVRVWGVAAAALISLVGLGFWFFRVDPPSPAPADRPSRPSSAPVVMAGSLDVLRLSEIAASPPRLLGGHQARFRVRLANTASGPADDPRRVNAGAKVIAQVATFVVPASARQQVGGGNRRPVAFPRKLPAAMIPPPGQTRDLDLDFSSAGIAAGQYDVVFELQSPQGTRINRLSASLVVDENLAAIDLIGFDQVRTSLGGGADTYVRPDSQEPFGARPSIEAGRKPGGGDMPEVTHAYLRFDLRDWAGRRQRIDRAMLLLTLDEGGSSGNCAIEAYGVTALLPPDWKETGDGAIQWHTSPSAGDIESYPFLGRAEFDNEGGRLDKVPDGVRLFGPGLDDYLRETQGDTVTVLLVRANDGAEPIRWVSREGGEAIAPAMAIRESRAP
jgi:predicted Ser/Thr protein kinase